MIHSPKILFLDEPTIGLDITSQKAIRQFLKEINQQERVTIILTSHYMQDIEALCQRVIVLANGTVLDDLSIDALKHKYTVSRNIVITYKTAVPTYLAPYQQQELIVSIPEEAYTELIPQLDLTEIQTIQQQDSALEDIIFHLITENR